MIRQGPKGGTVRPVADGDPVLGLRQFPHIDQNGTLRVQIQEQRQAQRWTPQG